MKYITSIVFFVLCMVVKGKTIPVVINTVNETLVVKEDLTPNKLLSQIINIKPHDITRLTGKKLSVKEKIALEVLKYKANRQLHRSARGNAPDNGKTALILGLIGLIGLCIPVLNIASIPLAILAITIGSKAKKEDRYNKKARTAITLGIITLGLLVIIGFTVAIVLTVGSVPR